MPAHRPQDRPATIRRAWAYAFRHASLAGYTVTLDDDYPTVWCPSCEQRVLDSVARHRDLHEQLGAAVPAYPWWQQ